MAPVVALIADLLKQRMEYGRKLWMWIGANTAFVSVKLRGVREWICENRSLA